MTTTSEGNRNRARTASRVFRSVRPNGAVDYTRFSTSLQASIPEQKAINAELADMEGLVILRSFSDEAVSRSVSDRKDLVAMFKFIEQNAADIGYIIVNELERLTGDTSQHETVVQLVRKYDIHIVTEDMDPIDPFNDEAMQRAAQRALDAKNETLKVSRRTKRSLRAKVKAGTVAMSPAYGTRMKALVTPQGVELASGTRYLDTDGRVVRSGVIEVHPDEIEWVRKIYEWADQGVSYEDIARKLAAKHVPTKRGKNGWRATVIGQLLENPFYKGNLTWGLQEVKTYNGKAHRRFRPEGDPGRIDKPSPLGPLVDVELWERVNERIARRREERTRTMTVRKPGNASVLHDLVYCARCGHKMYARNDAAGPAKRHLTPKMRYRCQSNRQGNRMIRDGFTQICEVPMSMSEKLILEALATLNKSHEQSQAGIRTKRGDRAASLDSRRKVEAEIKVIDAKIEKAQRHNLNDLITDEQLARFVTEFTAERLDAEQRLARTAVQHEPSPTPERVRGVDFEALAVALGDGCRPIHTRAALLHDARIERIWVDNPVIEVEFFD